MILLLYGGAPMCPFLPLSLLTLAVADLVDGFVLSIDSFIGPLFTGGVIACLARSASTNPFIDFRKLEPEKPPDAMGRQPHLLYPTIYRVFVDSEMCGYILDPNPSFLSGHFIPLGQFLVRRLRKLTKQDRNILK
jgi:hypothetical protein